MALVLEADKKVIQALEGQTIGKTVRDNLELLQNSFGPISHIFT